MYRKNSTPRNVKSKNDKEKDEGEYVLDPSNALVINIPNLPKPNTNKEKKPQWYWNDYNEALSLYKNKKKYDKVKEKLIKLLKYDDLPTTGHTYLMRTYRKIMKREIEKNNLIDAYNLYQEYFQNCKDNVTNTDRKKYNKLIDKISEKHPELDYSKLELKEKRSYEIVSSDVDDIELLEKKKITREERGNKKNRNFIKEMNNGYVYIDRNYNKELSKYDSTMITFRNKAGYIEDELQLGHGVYRFEAARESDRFVISSDDMIFYYYSLENGCIHTYKLGSLAKDKYHVRCVDISPNGKYFLFSYVDKVQLFDSNRRTIGLWKTPIKEGWKKRDTSDEMRAEYKKYLSILGLSNNPTNKQIKKAFRSMVIKHHPDRNQGDPNAREKTKQIIEAYEKLTGEDAKQAFKGMKEESTYYKMIDRIEVEIPGTSETISIEFGMSGQAEDWIYATEVSKNANRIYLGGYSGKIYCVSKNGQVSKFYDVHETPSSIREEGDYLYIETNYHLYIIKDDRYLTHIDTWDEGDLMWWHRGFMFVEKNEISLFSWRGTIVGNISFKKNIYDLYWEEEKLRVVTVDRSYLIKI